MASSGRSSTDAKLIPAGTIEQGQPRFWDPPCSIGYTNRPSKRGGRYQATVSHFPMNSLQLIDMSSPSPKLHCKVLLPGKPDRVVYVPPKTYQTSAGMNDTFKGGIITMSILAIVALFTMVVTFLSRHRQKQNEDKLHFSVSDLDMENVSLESPSQSSGKSVAVLPEMT